MFWFLSSQIPWNFHSDAARPSKPAELWMENHPFKRTLLGQDTRKGNTLVLDSSWKQNLKHKIWFLHITCTRASTTKEIQLCFNHKPSLKPYWKITSVKFPSQKNNCEWLFLGLDTTRTRGSTQVVSKRDTWKAQTVDIQNKWNKPKYMLSCYVLKQEELQTL